MNNTQYVRNAVDSILESKRLLSDHLIIVEQCSNDIKDDKEKRISEEYSMLRRTLFLSASMIGSKLLFSRSKIFAVGSTIIATTSMTYYGWKLMKEFKLNWQWKKINQLLINLNSLDVCIRKNISFFKESQQLKFFNKTGNNNFIFYSIFAVTQALYDETKHLENYPLPTEYVDVYQNVENLQDCELFQRPTEDFDDSCIKDFYNIFLYIQSQFITRFALAIVYNTTEALTYLQTRMDKLITIIADNLHNDQERLINMKKALQRNNEQLHRANIRDHVTNEPIRHLKEDSLGFSMKILALATHCSNLDEIIQSIDNESYTTSANQIVPKDMENLRQSIDEIERKISLFRDDAKRLGLLFEKFLANRYNFVLPKEEENTNESTTQSTIELCEKIDESTKIEENQDYFANIDLAKIDLNDVDESKSKIYSLDDELNEINSKLVKRQFKPVLKQLKNKISPINVVMHKRELDYLQAKGLPTDDVTINENNLCTVTDSEDDSDDETIVKSRRRTQKDAYSERREFLQSKAPIIFMPPPPSFLMKNETFQNDEEILE